MAQSQITQDVLDSFVRTVDKYPNASDSELMELFEEFGGDANTLDNAKSYYRTRKKFPNSDLSEINALYPEFFGETQQKQPTQQPEQKTPTVADAYGNITGATQNLEERKSEQETKAHNAAVDAAQLPMTTAEQWRQDQLNRLEWLKIPSTKQWYMENGKLVYGASGEGYVGGLETQQKVEELKSKQPEHLKGEAKTFDEAQERVLTAAIQSTDYGKEGYDAYTKLVQTKKETLDKREKADFNELQGKVYAGTMTVDEAQKELQRRHEDYQKQLEDFANDSFQGFAKNVFEKNQDYLEKEYRRLGNKTIDRQITELSAEAMDKIKGILKNTEGYSSTEDLHSASPEAAARIAERGKIGYYNQALEYLKDAKKIKDAAAQGPDALGKILKNFFGSLGENIADMDTWDMGIGQLTRTGAFKKIIDKLEANGGDESVLTDDEKLMMQAGYTYLESCALNSSRINRAYKAGQTTAESIPFMLEFAMGFAGAAESAVARGIVRFGTKMFGKVAGNSARYMMRETIGHIVGLAAGTVLQTTLFGIPKIEEGSLQRQLGQVNVDMNDETGGFKFGGIEAGTRQSESEALTNSIIDNGVETASEMFFTQFNPLTHFAGNWLGATSMFQKVGSKNWVRGLIHAYNNPTFRNLRQRMQFGGYIGEVMEEEVGGLMRLMCSDVNDLKSAGLDKDSQIDTFLGLLPTSLFFLGIGGAGAVWNGIKTKYNTDKLLKSVSSETERKFFQQLINSSTSSGEFGEKAYDYIRGIINNGDLTQQQKQAGLAAVAGKYYDALSEDVKKAADDIAKEQYGGLIENFTKSITHKDGKMYGTVDNAGHTVFITNGVFSVKENKDGVPTIRIPHGKTVTGVMMKEDGTLSKEIQFKQKDLHEAVQVQEGSKLRDMAGAAARAHYSGNDTFEFDGKTYSAYTLQETEPVKKKEEQPAEQSSGPKPIKKVIAVDNGRGKLVQATVIYDGANVHYNEDGSIDESHSGDFSIKNYEGKEVSGKERAKWIAGINAVLMAERADAQQRAQAAIDEKVKAAKKAQEDADYKKAVDEARKKRAKELVEKIKEKDGWIDTEARDITPEMIFWYTMTHADVDTAFKDAVRVCIQATLRKAKLNTEEGEKEIPDETKRIAEIHRCDSKLKGYEEAVKFWVDDTDTAHNVGQFRMAVAEGVNKALNITEDEAPGTIEDKDKPKPINKETKQEPKEEPKTEKLTNEEAERLILDMEKEATVAYEMELTPENWVSEFGENGEVTTPIGVVKMGEGQYFKLAQKGRDGKLGMIKPTLEHPFAIIEDASESKEGDAERKSSYVFVRAFTDKDGNRIYYFTSVTVLKDGREVVISNQEKNKNRIKRLLKEGRLAYIRKATLPSESDTPEQGDQPTNHVGDVLSGRKGTNKNPIVQEKTEKNAKKLKISPKWPNPFDENIALVKTANGRVVFKSRAEVKDGELEKNKVTVYVKEGGNYVPYTIRSAKEKHGLNSTVPVVDANGVEKSVYANQLYADANGEKPFVENQNTKLKVDNFGQVAAYPVYTSANGTQFTLQDLLTEHRVNPKVNDETKKVKTESMSGYEYVKQQVEAENPDDQKAIERFHADIKHVIDMWNALADKLLDSKGYNKAMLLAYRYLYYKSSVETQYNLAAEAEKEGKDASKFYAEAHKIDANMDGKVSFSVGVGFDPKNLKGKALNNPLYRLSSMIEITKDMPEVKGIEFDMQLPEDIEKALKAKIITAKQIEDARVKVKAIAANKKASENEINWADSIENDIPEVKTTWAPLTRPAGKEGYDKVKPLLKQEAGETRRNKKLSKEQEALKTFRDLCQEAINALRSNNKVLFNKLNAQIGKTVIEHMTDKVNKFANQMVSYQNNIRNILTTAFPEVAEIAKRHKRLDSALNEQTKRINEADEALQDVKRLEGELEGLKTMGDTEDVLKQIETTSKRLESAREKLAAKEARRDEPMLQDVRKLTEELSTYQAEHPEAEQQYQEMTQQEFPEGGLRIEFQTGETAPMAEFTETEKKSKQARLAYNALVAALQRVKGLNLHMVGSQEEAQQWLSKHADEKDIEFIKNGEGTIYGWSIGNDMYLTDEGLNPETPIHEYTHIWLNALKVGNKAAYDKVLRAIKARKGLWEKVTKDPAYAHLTTDEEIASEVLARYSGKRGAARLMEVAKELYGQKPDAEPTTLTKTFISKMQSILKEFWDAVKGLFGIQSMDDISDWALKDLFDGKPLDFNTEEMQAIKDKAIADGTFMKTPDGRPTKLTEKQWLQVRTKAFKEWYGDWENPKEGEFFLLDGNEYVWDEAQQKYTFVLKGEPQLAYHGTEYAGYDLMDPKDYDELDENGNPKSSGRGIFMTPHQFVAGVYAGLTGEDVTENEALIGDDPHRGIYSLYNNMHNPLIVNCADEEGNASMWNSIPTGIWKIVGGDMPTQYFNSYDEAVEAYYEQGWGINPEGTDLEEPELVPETHTTDEFVELARAQGYDGVIFMNVIDGTDSKLLDDDVEGRDYMRAHDVYVALTPNQVKSATQNNGLFSMEDARIEYQYTDAQLKELDEPTEKRIRKEEDKGTEHMLDPDMSDQERENWWESVVTRIADQSNGMRLMLNSINAYRKLQGLEPLDMDKYDVRTKFEACRSIIANKVGFLERGVQMELDDTIRELADVVGNSQFYKDHMKEVGGDKPAMLTPVQFIERYLMARNNWERAKEGVARGLAEFKERMGMGSIEFANAFTEAYGEQAVLNLWDKIRAMTDFALDTNFEGGMISEELYQELKAKKFYVPQRGFWDDVNPENEEEGKEELLQRRQRGNSIARNKLDSMHKAEGGESLAEGCLAYIARDARQAIKLSEENKVKKVMFDLLRDNEDWCHLPEHNFKVPRQVFYTTNEDGEIVRMDDGPTDEQRKLMSQLKGIIKELKEQYQKAETDEERDAIQEEIYATEAQFPYFDEKDSYRILHTRAKTNKALVGLYINGVPCEIEMTPRFILTADALNGRRDKRGEISALKTVTSWLSAQFTMNNPTFFAVNITRDTPLILTKGAVEYGPEFSARFTANWAVSQKAIWTYLLKGEIDNTDTGAQLRDFLMNGGNTGYSNLEELDRWRRRVADLNPGGSLNVSDIADKLSTIKGAKELGVDLLKGTLKIGDKAIGWAELRPLAQVLNEWSEIISRFSAYKSVVDMGIGVNEGIKAAHNLSTNFNRRGLGAPFINFFNSLTVFANAGIQGASGYWRTLDAQGGAGEKAKKIAKTAAYMGMLPAFLGFVATMFNPDDDEYEYMVSEYERDNYIVLGDKRLALNEQLKPWWVIGVNAALLCRGKRTLKQASNSVLTSMFTNWLPLPQNLTGSINMLTENITGKEEWNIAQIARQAIMPSAMQTMNQWADNKNFLGGKLRYDIGDIPEYEMAPNEAALYRDLAKVFYVWGGGNELVPSKTKEDGSKIRRWWDVNPKEIKSNTFWIPSGALDNFCLAYGLAKDTKERIEGDYHGTNVRVKDMPVINRFYKPSDKTLYRYAVVREARDIVQRHDDRINNLEKQVKHFSDVYAKTGTEEAKASLDEAKRLLSEEKHDVTATKMKKVLDKYNKKSIRALQNKLGESNKELKLYHEGAVDKLDDTEYKLVQMLTEGVNLKTGLRHSTDVPEWIQWFDDHSGPRQDRRE